MIHPIGLGTAELPSDVNAASSLLLLLLPARLGGWKEPSDPNTSKRGTGTTFTAGEQTQKKRFCSNCGCKVVSSEKFCEACGLEINPEDTESIWITMEEQQQQQKQQQQKQQQPSSLTNNLKQPLLPMSIGDPYGEYDDDIKAGKYGKQPHGKN